MVTKATIALCLLRVLPSGYAQPPPPQCKSCATRHYIVNARVMTAYLQWSYLSSIFACSLHGPVREENVVSTNADGARSVFAADLDGDGDMDVLSASSYDDKIAWFDHDHRTVTVAPFHAEATDVGCTLPKSVAPCATLAGAFENVRTKSLTIVFEGVSAASPLLVDKGVVIPPRLRTQIVGLHADCSGVSASQTPCIKVFTAPGNVHEWSEGSIVEASSSSSVGVQVIGQGGMVSFNAGMTFADNQVVALAVKGGASLQLNGNVSFSHNHASAILATDSSTVEVYGTASFDSNSSPDRGGAVVLARQSVLLIQSGAVVDLFNNTAAEGGGAAALSEQSSLTVAAGAQVAFHSNTAASGDGGAVWLSSGSTANIREVKFTANTAPAGNGGSLFGGALTFTIGSSLLFEVRQFSIWEVAISPRLDNG